MTKTVGLNVQFQCRDLSELVESNLEDVGPNGLFIRTQRVVPEGTRVVFDFRFANDAPCLRGRGVVVWVTEEHAALGLTAGMDIHFNELEPECEGRWRWLLRERRRRVHTQEVQRFASTLCGLAPDEQVIARRAAAAQAAPSTQPRRPRRCARPTPAGREVLRPETLLLAPARPRPPADAAKRVVTPELVVPLDASELDLPTLVPSARRAPPTTAAAHARLFLVGDGPRTPPDEPIELFHRVAVPPPAAGDTERPRVSRILGLGSMAFAR